MEKRDKIKLESQLHDAMKEEEKARRVIREMGQLGKEPGRLEKYRMEAAVKRVDELREKLKKK